jgi:hypothetical protein
VASALPRLQIKLQKDESFPASKMTRLPRPR